ncbi:hypothetical protein KEM55_001782 [Ascosphaera atra]|nr:hypothetical protein KEM55_001782 [Ascosphaera atra]
MGPGAVAPVRRLTDIQFDLTVDLNKGLGPGPRAGSEVPDPSRSGADGSAGDGIVEGSSPSENDAGLGACIDALPEVSWHDGSLPAANGLMVPNDVESALLASADFATSVPSMVAESMLPGVHAEDLASSLASSLFSALSLPLGTSG